MVARSEERGSASGCGFLLLNALLASFLLACNTLMLVSTYPAITPLGPPWLRDPRVEQGVLFIGPVVLLLMQWWLIDRLVDIFSGWRSESSDADEE